ncbi:hypothetical protein [Bradyrhizobium sp. USDA 4454]
MQLVGDIKDTGCFPDIFVQKEFVAVGMRYELGAGFHDRRTICIGEYACS